MKAKITTYSSGPACSKINLRLIEWDEWQVQGFRAAGDDPEALLGEVVYPAPQEVPEGLPRSVRNAYQEALAVRSASANAYSVMLGRVLEIACRDRKASGRALYNQISDLGSRNEIPETIVKVAHGVRKLRNVGAHAAVGSLTAEDAPIVERLTRAVLEFVYTAPHLAREAQRVGKKNRSAIDRTEESRT